MNPNYNETTVKKTAENVTLISLEVLVQTVTSIFETVLGPVHNSNVPWFYGPKLNPEI